MDHCVKETKLKIEKYAFSSNEEVEMNEAVMADKRTNKGKISTLFRTEKNHLITHKIILISLSINDDYTKN